MSEEGAAAATRQGREWREQPEGAFGRGRQATHGHPGGRAKTQMPSDLPRVGDFH